MHRDYQNIAVNGARSSSMADTIIKTLARNATYDRPLYMSYALIGNGTLN
jgi:acyloxyacyl hydrolase